MLETAYFPGESVWRQLTNRLANGEVMVLVTVARVAGSTPREVGASMLVGASDIAGTIGGGHLEWKAIEHARTLLDSGKDGSPARQLEKLSLAANLGQCCGGVAWLLYERIGASDLAGWIPLVTALDNGQGAIRHISHDSASDWTIGNTLDPLDAGLNLQDNDWHFSQFLEPASVPLLLFGAGHVGEALVRVLAPTGWPVRWIDTREQIPSFERPWPACVTTEATDVPEDSIAAAPAGAYYLVMTHRHDLDLFLAEKILERGDFAYFGMIGSANKRASFTSKLKQRGLDPSRMTCPIGVPGISSKLPAAIAIAIATQLLQWQESLAALEPA